MSELTAKEEAFCQAYVFNGGNATDAWNEANPKSKAKPTSRNELASRLLANVKIKSRIKALKKKASEQSERDFGVSVEWRLEMLKKIADAGMEQWHDQGGNARRENLAAARGAIQTINDMLGVALPGTKGQRKSFNVNLRIQDASLQVDSEGDDE